MNRSTSVLICFVLASSVLGGCAANADEPASSEDGAAITSTASPPPPAAIAPAPITTVPSTEPAPLTTETKTMMVSVIAEKRECRSCYAATGSYWTCVGATAQCNFGVVAVIATLGAAAASEFAAMLAAFGWDAVSTLTVTELLTALGVVGAATAAFEAWWASCQLGYCGILPDAKVATAVTDSASGIFAAPAAVEGVEVLAPQVTPSH
jgi:hypothetical protein